MLSGQITDLTSLWQCGIAHDELAAVGGIQVAHGCGAVSVSRDGESVDVPGEGTELGLIGQIG